ncbi:MAG: M23 family metallopeptidase [Nitrospiraceae bacterium]|nr:MAG: M23 family metallopeptidase [Nitrospiraceae bacterium]
MLVNLIYKLLIIILCTPAFALAFHVTVTPESVSPGDLFLVQTQAGPYKSASAEFMGKTIKLHMTENNRYQAFVPVDVNTAPGKYNLLVSAGEDTFLSSVTVQSKEFETIYLTLPEGKVTLSPENQKRAADEAELLNSIWQLNNDKKWNGTFSKPLSTEISTEFGVKRIMNEKKTSVHRGTDFRGTEGTPVRSLNAGTVVLNKDLFYGGNTLIVDHGMGLYSVYMHMSEFKAAKGDKVAKGQTIGLVGMSGRATGPHLHLSVKLYGISVNPESLFNLKL